MHIRHVSWAIYRLPFVRPFATAHGVAIVREGVVLRLATDDGLVGLGEASPLPAFGGGTTADAVRAITELAPALLGLDLQAADRLLAALDTARPAMAAVACALDTALCDLRARDAGISVALLLGGQPDRPVPVNATIGGQDPDAAAAAAHQARRAGFRCVKLKVGITDSPQAEVARIAAVREALGPEIALRLDANGAWDVQAAIAIIHAAERYGLELVEQPVAANDLAGLAAVRSAVATPIAADEAVSDPQQAREVIAAHAADVLVVKPMLAGGLRAAQQIIAMAQEHGLYALVTTTIDAGIAVAAALHLATMLPAPPLACGLATGLLLTGDLLACPLLARDGAMSVPSACGLGVSLDEQQLARYASAWYEVAI